MNVVVYTQNEAYKKHIEQVFDGSVKLRESLSGLRSIDALPVIIHASSFASADVNEALKVAQVAGLVVAIADDLPDIGIMLRYTQMGVQGYCNAFMVQAHYQQLVQMLAQGQSWFPPSLLSQAFMLAHDSVKTVSVEDQLPQLTERQKQIALSIARGKSNKQVANEFDISERTVKAHLTQIFTKLGVADRLSLVVYLKQHNILDDHEHLA